MKTNRDQEIIFVCKILRDFETFVFEYYNYIIDFFNFMIESSKKQECKKEVLKCKEIFYEKHESRFKHLVDKNDQNKKRL